MTRDYRKQVCRYCGVTVANNKSKYCDKSPQDDPGGKNEHSWKYPEEIRQPQQLTIADLIAESHATAVEKGWWEETRIGGILVPRSAGDQFTNFHAELSEAWEEWRKYGWSKPIYQGEDGKPEGTAVELADLFIRIADTCAKYGLPLEEALLAKMAYNKTRPHRHGGKFA